MIKLETAVALKDAGLKWEPKAGDSFAYTNGRTLEEIGFTPNIFTISSSYEYAESIGGEMMFFNGGLCVRGQGNVMNETRCDCMNKKGIVPYPDIDLFDVCSWEKQSWLPSLSKLLAEIEGRGYLADSSHPFTNRYICILSVGDKTRGLEIVRMVHMEKGETREEAAAQALLWILRQEGGRA